MRMSSGNYYDQTETLSTSSIILLSAHIKSPNRREKAIRKGEMIERGRHGQTDDAVIHFATMTG